MVAGKRGQVPLCLSPSAVPTEGTRPLFPGGRLPSRNDWQGTAFHGADVILADGSAGHKRRLIGFPNENE